jgi:RimJ/RimL family protein N-acetyltransferase
MSVRAPTLRAGPLVLRPMDLQDAAVLTGYFKDPGLAHLLGLTGPRDDAFVPALIRATGPDPMAVYVTITFDGRVVGYSFMDHIDLEHRHAVETGVLLGERALWGRRVGRAAFGMLLEHGFDAMGLHRASLAVLEENVRAIRTYEALGFRQEGRRREALILDTGPADTIIMGVLAPELNRVAIDEAIETIAGVSRTRDTRDGHQGGVGGPLRRWGPFRP